MSIEVDLLMDRRRLKRRLAFWRVIAVVAVLACIALGFARAGAGIARAHVARLTVDGIITDDRQLTREIDRVARDDSAKALIVAIDSPGGSVGGGESIYNSVARVAAAKPVVAVMGGTAASAGYMIAMPAQRIFAQGSTLTGSIGVILETGDVSGLLAKIGVSADPIVSGPLKAQPSFVKPLSPEGHDVLQGLVNNLFDQFVQKVANGRHMPADRVRQLADGRAYTGQQALQLGLIDQIGGEAEARAWLQSEKKVSASLPVTEVRTRSFAQRALGASLGLLFVHALKTVKLQGLNLDGAWALWQPSNM
ncbi:MAG TPA: signal peptide peptidase SppA [Acetobacteraceae bacterium]|jgi:protease-4|nr:signal peptide peptidase SppA [Acetobacteraceae bacterium]